MIDSHIFSSFIAGIIYHLHLKGFQTFLGSCSFDRNTLPLFLNLLHCLNVRFKLTITMRDRSQMCICARYK